MTVAVFCDVLLGKVPGPAEVSDNSSVYRLETTQRAAIQIGYQSRSVTRSLVR